MGRSEKLQLDMNSSVREGSDFFSPGHLFELFPVSVITDEAEEDRFSFLDTKAQEAARLCKETRYNPSFEKLVDDITTYTVDTAVAWEDALDTLPDSYTQEERVEREYLKSCMQSAMLDFSVLLARRIGVEYPVVEYKTDTGTAVGKVIETKMVEKKLPQGARSNVRVITDHFQAKYKERREYTGLYQIEEQE